MYKSNYMYKYVYKSNDLRCKSNNLTVKKKNSYRNSNCSHDIVMNNNYTPFSFVR